MTNYGMNGYSPYGNMYSGFNSMGSQPMNLPTYTIIKVSGEQGARALPMAPNSECLLMDETAPIVWVARTDGAGYKTVTPFRVEPYQPDMPNQNDDINERLKRLEETVYAQSYDGGTQQPENHKPSKSNEPNAKPR